MLWLFKINFHKVLIHGNSSYVVLYRQCLRYNICSTWFLDIRISTCFKCTVVARISIILHARNHPVALWEGDLSLLKVCENHWVMRSEAL